MGQHQPEMPGQEALQEGSRRLTSASPSGADRAEGSVTASLSGVSRQTVTRKWTTFECVRCGSSTRAIAETNRATNLLCRTCFGKGKDRRPRELNELTGKEWAQKSRSVSEYPDTRSDKQRFHGASFPQSLAREQIEILLGEVFSNDLNQTNGLLFG